MEVYLPFEGIVNLDSLKDRFSRDLVKVSDEINTLKKRIANKNFIDKAPREIVEDCQNKLKEANLHSEAIQKKLEMLH